jgi:hypothetical protein
MQQGAAGTAERADASLTLQQAFEAFKFYEEAAEKTRTHAWSQTTWILTLNAGIIAFSLNFYAQHSTNPAFLPIELVAVGVGLVLCLFLIYLLQQLGGHISHYWTTSNKLAAGYPPLKPFISEKDARQAGKPDYRAPFPAFCRRLQFLAVLFMAAHLGWAVVVVRVLAA